MQVIEHGKVPKEWTGEHKCRVCYSLLLVSQDDLFFHLDSIHFQCPLDQAYTLADIYDLPEHVLERVPRRST